MEAIKEKRITSNEVYERELAKERKLDDMNKQLGYDLRESKAFLEGLENANISSNDF